MTPNYTCPLCGEPSALIVSEVQAFCTNIACNVMSFNPSLPDQGMGNVNIIELPQEWKDDDA